MLRLMTQDHSLIRRSRGALAAAGAIAFLLAGMMQAGAAHAAVLGTLA
jgi:hypothetical protein